MKDAAGTPVEAPADGDKEQPDVWNVLDFHTNEKPWVEKSGAERAQWVLVLFCKVVLALLLLYMFIISLGLMANSFRILGGKTSGRAFRDSELFNNPLAGLVTGIIVTVLVQSSSTSTSIIITMTAGDLITIKNAIPMIMGANIGTSVTNTLVSLGSFADKDEYRRAFAGATVHDCFNFLTVLMLLPLEAITGVLRHIASGIVDGMDITDDEEKGSKTDFLKKLTKPVSTHLLGIDKKLITTIAKEDDPEKLKAYDDTSIIKYKQKDDNHIFMDTPMSDTVAGILMVFVSLMFLCVCLMMLVKLLQTIFRGQIAIMFRKALNLETPSVPFLANYILIVFGMAITILFQSSSVTTSTLTPLVGIGLVKIEKMFAFTVGANVGTTLTGILSALVSDKRKTGLTVAFTHTLFNLVGILVWYPFPPVRSVPISMAKILGNIAADWKWFPIAYIIFMFLAFPALLLGLSVASPWLAAFVGVPFILVVVAAWITIALRERRPNVLPSALRSDPSWLPNGLRVEKEEEKATGSSVREGGVSADLGAGNWQQAPSAWGTGWFILLALLAVVFNAKWADLKYTSWDKRDHYGFSGWSACSYAYKKDMPWAPVLNEALCNAASCGSKSIADCKKGDFSSTLGSNDAYQKSWLACRETCSTKQWEAWCKGMQCAGSDHELQCTNVSAAVHRPYEIRYGPAGKKAWVKQEGFGTVCKDLGDICTGVDGAIGSAGSLAVVGLIFVIIGQACLLTYSMKQDKLPISIAAAACFALAWIMLLASWATFASTMGSDAECIVEAESKKGAVIAVGKFGDIINGSGSYTFGYVIGAWLLDFVTIALISLRIKDVKSKGSNVSASEPPKPVVEPKESDVVAPSAKEPEGAIEHDI